MVLGAQLSWGTKTTPPPNIFTLNNWGNTIASIGLFLLYAIIGINYSGIYRLPQENYALMVSTHAGIVIFYHQFKTSRPITIQEDLVSGFLSAINSMFNEALQSQKAITQIASGDAAIQIETGQYIKVAFLAQTISGVVAGEMRRFVQDFERTFAEPLQRADSDVGKYQGALELVKKRFPFFEYSS